jgi:hypothetical protein
MSALVVYESHWGNTAAIAQAIAAGIGGGACAVPTSEATPEALKAASLLVVGAPILGFALPTKVMVEGLGGHQPGQPAPADISHAPVREWLESVPGGDTPVTAFETRVGWSPGSAMRAIVSALEHRGYRRISAPEAFIVTGRYGPLRSGEIERATAWGAELATLLG